MSAVQTLKLLNSIKTSTSSASHRHRRRSSATAAMFQSSNFFPHCQPQQQQQFQHQHQQQFYTAPAAARHPTMNDCLSSGAAHHTQHAQYQQFVTSFVTPTTPASSDHQTSYHGTAPNVTSPLLPPPYYFHTPPISSIGGAGGAAALADAARPSSTTHHQQQLCQPTAHALSQNALHTRSPSDVHKKPAAACSPSLAVSQSHFSNFQFAFEAQPPVYDPIPAITSSLAINSANPPQTSNSHSRPQPSFAQIHQQQQSFSFLPLNPEPTPACSPQPHHHFKQSPNQAVLPTGCFFSLTPEDPQQPLCTTAQQQPSNAVRDPQPATSYFPVMPVNPVVQQVAPRATFATGYMGPAYQRLTRHAISAVDSRDSREFRWNRVLRYVHDVSAPHGAAFPPSDAWIRQQRQRVLSSPRDNVNERHSLWDGGSLGTNGVDDFVWDDDLSNGKRFTIPPRSQQGDGSREEDKHVFSIEPSTSMKADYDLAFGYEVDDSASRPPAKRTKSNESQKAARRGLHEYLAALKSFELAHVQDMKREAPLTMA
ncbi:hypothetical protein Dda_1240 [Drechslerella dactyloides]|uniref:Uncharacterized protein n=1 Tax=Drechslerella dactyloides TaxID=74499 RepID=A0AAD6J328_DREDA|nr:hypothetical protein Dda_1240 [Drechslerella dactyloides]